MWQMFTGKTVVASIGGIGAFQHLLLWSVSTRYLPNGKFKDGPFHRRLAKRVAEIRISEIVKMFTNKHDAELAKILGRYKE